jgi:hypothetical protein
VPGGRALANTPWSVATTREEHSARGMVVRENALEAPLTAVEDRRPAFSFRLTALDEIFGLIERGVLLVQP